MSEARLEFKVIVDASGMSPDPPVQPSAPQLRGLIADLRGEPRRRRFGETPADQTAQHAAQLKRRRKRARNLRSARG